MLEPTIKSALFIPGLRVAATLIGMAVILAASCTVYADDELRPWIRVSKETLAGNLSNYAIIKGTQRIPNYFDILDPLVDPKRMVLYADRMESTVFQASSGVVRSFDFPANEIVNLLSGTTVFIDEPSGVIQTFKEGDYFVVPKHWRGIQIMKSAGANPYREHPASARGDWYSELPLDRAAAAAEFPKPPSVIRLDLEAARLQMMPVKVSPTNLKRLDEETLLGHTLFSGEPSLMLYNAPRGAAYQATISRCDEMVRVIAGSVTLEDLQQKSETFGPQDVFVTTRTFRGKIRLSAGFRGVVVISAGTEHTETIIKRSAIELCPAV